jgi:ABC-type multidrug transport system fused ATPase/permease subunit
MFFSTAWVAVSWLVIIGVGFMVLLALASFGQGAKRVKPFKLYQPGAVIPIPSGRIRKLWRKQRDAHGHRNRRPRKHLRGHREHELRAVK